MQNPQDVQKAANYLKSALPPRFFESARAPVALILGTGLAQAAGAEKNPLARVPFANVPGLPTSGVSSHRGEFIAHMEDGLPVLIQSGRVHLYEGKSPAEVCMGVAVMACLGCKSLIITNAAGCLNPLFSAPGLMLISDIINFTGASPLTGIDDSDGRSRFADMSAPFDAALRALAAQKALALGISLPKGVYIGVHGPEMETPAETRMYRNFGADAIGMSTCMEVIAARHLGLSCLGISCLTNKNLPDCMQPAPLSEVIAAAAVCAKTLAPLLQAILQAMARPS